ncbi:MAG TPA: glucokinase [Candidatus Binatia bacterium]|nr:glucokinase [Candidatus Binatia bacterium]
MNLFQHSNRELILAGDIGGTKTHLALYSHQNNNLKAELEKTFPSQEYSGLEPILQEFLASGKYPIGRASFGIAGPLVDGRVNPPNLDWIVDPLSLAQTLKLPSVSLLNDLEAAAYGVFTLAPEEFLVLNEGVSRRPGNKAVIAAGTGLGETILFDDGKNYYPLASEGGHADFAARNEMEIELLRYLIGRFGRVSYERVVSGPGLANIYDFLIQKRDVAVPGPFAEKIAAAEDRSALISQAALAGEPEIAVKALDLFVSSYGAEAGNLALKGKAIGGVYVGGGIAPKILSKLKDGTFMHAFNDKGRYRDLVSSIPVYVILNEKAALRGAAYHATLNRSA